MKCPVCLIPFCELEVETKLTCCGHAFCCTCLDMWEISHNTCPLCRSNLDGDKQKAIRQLADAMFLEGIRVYIRSSRSIPLPPIAPRCVFFCAIFWQPFITSIPEEWKNFYRQTNRNDVVELLTSGRSGIIVSYDLKPPNFISFCNGCDYITTDPWKLQRHRRQGVCD